eukprot:444742-Pelagomonas_calceolata.AAC.1
MKASLRVRTTACLSWGQDARAIYLEGLPRVLAGIVWNWWAAAAGLAAAPLHREEKKVYIALPAYEGSLAEAKKITKIDLQPDCLANQGRPVTDPRQPTADPDIQLM